jgi:FKBP-type peptidyl-prolyl cis-trans isomerase
LKKLLLAALVAAGITGACVLVYKSPVVYDPYTTAGGVVVQDLVIPVQDDLPFITGTERVRFHMIGRVLDENGGEGAEFENTYDRGEPLEVDLSEDPLPAGLLEGIANMRVLGRRQMTVPPELAFGADGLPDRGVPGDATVQFEVELMERLPQK